MLLLGTRIINQSIKIFLYKLIGFRIEQKYSIVCFGVWSVTTFCFLLSDILCLVILVVVVFIFSFLKWKVYLLCLFMVRFDLVNLVKQVLENRMFLKIWEGWRKCWRIGCILLLWGCILLLLYEKVDHLVEGEWVVE